jgi:DNA-binding response OmpR family regulator
MAKKILVVDDDQLLMKILKINLEADGYEFIDAYDGDEALEKIRNNKLDLLVLDIMMPKVDGWQVAKEVRANPEIRYLPIIFLTCKGSEEDQKRGREEFGAEKYMVKPFSPEELLNAIKEVLSKH